MQFMLNNNLYCIEISWLSSIGGGRQGGALLGQFSPPKFGPKTIDFAPMKKSPGRKPDKHHLLVKIASRYFQNKQEGRMEIVQEYYLLPIILRNRTFLEMSEKKQTELFVRLG